MGPKQTTDGNVGTFFFCRYYGKSIAEWRGYGSGHNATQNSRLSYGASDRLHVVI